MIDSLKKEFPMRLLILTIISLLIVCGCNTMQGLGKDIETLGDGISRTASKVKD